VHHISVYARKGILTGGFFTVQCFLNKPVLPLTVSSVFARYSPQDKRILNINMCGREPVTPQKESRHDYASV
jgi:hypothetical protein